MTDHSKESAAEEQIELMTALFVHISVCVLFLYDYILNLAEEVELFWHSTFHLNTILYFICRYLPFSSLIFDLATVEVGLGKRSSMVTMLFVQVDAAIHILRPLLRVCNRFRYLIDVLQIMDNLAVNALLVIQTSALYNHDRKLAAVLALFGISVTMVSSVRQGINPVLMTPRMTVQLQIVILFFQTVFPVVILVSSLWKVIIMAGLRHKFNPRSRGGKLTSVIIFQTFCLAGFCVCRIFNAIWYFLAPTSVNLSVTPFLLPLGGICIIRFLLSLKKVGGDSNVDSTDTVTTLLSTVIVPIAPDCFSAELHPVSNSRSYTFMIPMKNLGRP